MKSIVVLCPTVFRATTEWKKFLAIWSTIIKKANRPDLCVELLNGQKVYFIGETEGQRRLRGLNADIVSAEEFVGLIAERTEE